jgi:NitT/TauT family transport system ATP-binding protein
MENVGIDLPDERSQLETRSLPRFGELRKHVYAQIQMAKQGWPPPAERKT